MHDGIKVNLLDTPGYADFVGELRAGLRAADAALFVVSAVDGMDAATAALWEECAAVGMPRAVAITRLDHPRADFDETRRRCASGSSATACCRSTCRCSATTASPSPACIGPDHPAGLRLLRRATRRQVREPDPEHLPAIEEARNELIEGIIAESEDETLMDRYLGGEEIDDRRRSSTTWRRRSPAGTFYPVVPVCAETGVGLDALLEVLTSALPVAAGARPAGRHRAGRLARASR